MSLTCCKKVSPLRPRLPQESDRERIAAALQAAVYLSLEATVSYLCTDQEYVVDQIIRGEVDSVVIDDAYLLVYTVGSPWYTQELVVLEDMVLRIGSGSTFSVVTDYLDGLAEEFNCKVQLVGGALARKPRALSRLYQRSGYVIEGSPQLSKRRS